MDSFYDVIGRIEGHGGLGMRLPRGSTRVLYGLALMQKPRVYIDVGTFVGLSVLWVARAMEENNFGKIYTVEIDKTWFEIARNFAKEAGLAHRIEFILGDSADVLPDLPNGVSLALIDNGDKRRYVTDFEMLEPKLSHDAIVVA
ncbi:MAG: class I SAM-dependent methyltransferase, partial [Proteobacteria bacterium]|nr:class I SAM-dependent methyltransferase [Pseudomonadota bacterium]